MCEPLYVEKECVGCGNGFLTLSEVSEFTLYCTSNCEENHSIFDETTDKTIMSVKQLCN